METPGRPRKWCEGCAPPIRLRQRVAYRSVRLLNRACGRCGLAIELTRPTGTTLCRTCSEGRAYCPDCLEPFNCGAARNPGRCVSCRRKQSVAKAKAQRHLRRARRDAGDLTTAVIRQMLSATSKCVVCSVEMVDDGNQPNGKHLDHIVPLAHGGAHTAANVRVICRTCNLARGWSMQDVAGQLSIESFASFGETYADRKTRSASARADVRRQRSSAYRRERAARWIRLNTAPSRPYASQGRNQKIDPALIACMESWGWGSKRIAKFFGVDRTTARHHLRRARAVAR